MVVHSDNTVAEHSVRKGRAKCFDHTAVVHSIWTKVLELGAGMFIVRCGDCHGPRVMRLPPCLAFTDRVASKENLSDDPSRERYKLLRRMAKVLGVEVEPVAPCLDSRFEDAQSWSSLGVTAHSQWKALSHARKDVVVLSP